MKIKLLGTGSILTDHLSACALIDDNVLVDCPNGVIKSIRQNGGIPKKIDICLITHFHADHYFDLPFLILEQALGDERKNDLYIVGPKGIFQQIDSLFKLAYPEDWESARKKSKIVTIEVKDNDSVKLNGYIITAYKVNHSCCDAYGYTVTCQDKTAGFTGDTILCSNVEKIIENSMITFADMSFPKTTKTHMGFDSISFLINKYKNNHTIIPTHMSESARKMFAETFFTPPIEGTIFTI